MDTLNIGDIKNAKLSTIKIHKATIRDSEFRNVEVYNCTIYDSTVINSKMFDCSIFKSKFKSCELYGVKLVQCDFDNVTIKPRPPCLSKLPVEVREMIFELMLSDFEFATDQSHPFLAALRGTTELYMQAVEIFNKFNTFKVKCGNISYFVGRNRDISLSKNARQGIKKLIIDCDLVGAIHFEEIDGGLGTLTDLTLDMSWYARHGQPSDPSYYNVVKWIRESLNAVQSLAKLVVSTATIPRIRIIDFMADPDLYGPIQEPMWVDAIQFVSSKLGIEVQGTIVLDMDREEIVDEDGSYTIRDYGEIVWLWEAKRGETLKWKK